MRPLVLVTAILLVVLALFLAVPLGIGRSLFPGGLLLTVACIVLLLWLFYWRRLPPF